MKPCHWVSDNEVPGGRFLVPGCWNRAINGDDADCHCVAPHESVEEMLAAISIRLDKIEKKMKEKDKK